MHRLRWTAVAALPVAVLAGCGSDSGTAPTGGSVPRGEYIVQHVAACIDCHTPRLPNGDLDTSKLLSGALFADIVPGDDTQGLIYAPNLTPDSTGLKNWTDAQIKNAFQNGIDDNGDALFPIMPYYIFHNMTASDADAVVAYLRSIPAVNNVIPERQPLGFPFTQPAQPLPANAIPNTTLSPYDAHYENAVRGRYLATSAGVCIECHTKAAQGPVPLQLDSLFAGGRGFGAADLGLPSPPFPATIFSANITPDSTGIAGWNAEQIRTELHTGKDAENTQICPPMPVGPLGAFGGLTDQDALDIGWYITTLPPITNRVPDCTFPGP